MSPNKLFSPERLNMSGLKVNLEECQCQKNATDATQATNAPTGSSDSNATTYNQGNGQEELIMMTGPLGEVYTKALAQYFVKSPDKSLEDISIESQAQDVALTTAALREHIRKVVEQGAGVRIVDQSANIVRTPRIIAYAVPANATTQPENIVKVQAWVDKAKRTNREVVMICDSTITNTNWMGTNANVVFDDKIPTPFDIGQNFVRATENYFEPMGITVVNGARGFVDWVKENCGQGKYVPADPIGDQNTQTEVEDVSMEGFLDLVKSFFSSKKKDKGEKASSGPQKPEEYRIFKYLKNLSDPAYVKTHCVDNADGDANPGFFKLVDNLLKGEKVLLEVCETIDKLNEANLKKVPSVWDRDTGLAECEDNNTFKDVVSAVENVMKKFPRDLGYGIKLDEDKTNGGFPEYKLEVPPLSIEKVKLSQSQIVKLAKAVYDTKYFDMLPGAKWEYENELETYFDIKWRAEGTFEGKSAGYVLDVFNGRWYLDMYKAMDMFSLIPQLGRIFFSLFACLNNHLLDNPDKSE